MDGDVTYTQASAGHTHTVLLRSDGKAVACGENGNGQCDIPTLDGDVIYCAQDVGGAAFIVQAVVDNDLITFVSLDGATICCISYTDTDLLSAIHGHLKAKLGNIIGRCNVVLPTGDLLSAVLSRDPKAQLGPFLHQ